MEKLEIIRKHLTSNAQVQRGHNTFAFGPIEIKINQTPDAVTVRVSIYDADADRDLILYSPLESAVILENALGEKPPPDSQT
jgi:hypothetical protein